MYIHPVGRYRIFQLSESQFQQLLGFLLKSGDISTSDMDILRFKADGDVSRLDQYDAMNLNIYRDKYERQIPLERPRQSHMIRGDDIPGYADMLKDFVERSSRS